jgi:hypothetical protein
VAVGSLDDAHVTTFEGLAESRVIRASKGIGIAARRNVTLPPAGGHLVALVAWFDDDDRQQPRRLERIGPPPPANTPRRPSRVPHRSFAVDSSSIWIARERSEIARTMTAR